MTDKTKRAVLVTTDSSRRGVFAGCTIDNLADVAKTGLITLTDARNCIYWHQSIGGVLGLAATGPNSECRIGARAEVLVLNGVTSVALLSEEADKAWREAAVYAG